MLVDPDSLLSQPSGAGDEARDTKAGKTNYRKNDNTGHRSSSTLTKEARRVLE